MRDKAKSFCRCRICLFCDDALVLLMYSVSKGDDISLLALTVLLSSKRMRDNAESLSLMLVLVCFVIRVIRLFAVLYSAVLHFFR